MTLIFRRTWKRNTTFGALSFGARFYFTDAELLTVYPLVKTGQDHYLSHEGESTRVNVSSLGVHEVPPHVYLSLRPPEAAIIVT